MAYIVMADIATAYVVTAHVAMVYIAMTYTMWSRWLWPGVSTGPTDEGLDSSEHNASEELLCRGCQVVPGNNKYAGHKYTGALSRLRQSCLWTLVPTLVERMPIFREVCE